jgi:hypothetical protein
MTVFLLQESIQGEEDKDVSGFLAGNRTVEAPNGIARFTNLDVIVVGHGYKLKFLMDREWLVEEYISGSFSVEPGSGAVLAISVEPSTKGTTAVVLETQPVVKITDKYGNFNANAPPTEVLVNITSLKPDPLGWRAGQTNGSSVTSVRGIATFTDLTFFGLGLWYIDFEATMNFQKTSVRSKSPIDLKQLESKAVDFTLEMEFKNWNKDQGQKLLDAISQACGLDLAALEITQVRPGSVIASVAFHVPEPSQYWIRAANDLNTPNSKLKKLGVFAFTGPGISTKITLPSPPPPPEPPKPYTGMPLKAVEYLTDTINVVAIAATGSGVVMAIFSEVVASFAHAERISSLANPEGERMFGNNWHTGAAVFSGGAYRCFITQVQFVAAIASLGGRGGQPNFNFSFPEPVFRGVGNFSVHNQSHIRDVQLPLAVRTLAHKLDWTNLRSNITFILQNPDVFPRPCDVYAQQVTIGKSRSFEM